MISPGLKSDQLAKLIPHSRSLPISFTSFLTFLSVDIEPISFWKKEKTRKIMLVNNLNTLEQKELTIEKENGTWI